MKNFVFIFSLFLLLSISACSVNSSETTAGDSSRPSVMFEAVDFNSISENSTYTKGDSTLSVKSTNGETEIEYELEIEAAGRYAFFIDAMTKDSNVVIWMEDYIDNPDDRTYNITGAITLVPGSENLGSYRIDGSPLNAGIHKMRLHISESEVSLGNMQFVMLKADQKTDSIMKQRMDGDSLRIVWSDEFNEGRTPDASKWTYDVGNWGWGNNELQYYTERRTENARVENGNLVIEAIKNDMGFPWTSARLTTRGKISFIYGRIEFRAKVPHNRGNWAAGWTLGDNYIDELSWPYCGEIDILESVGYEMDDLTGNGVAHASAHCGAYYFKLENQPTATIQVNNMNNDFHTYAVDWSPSGIIAYVDDQEYFRYEDTTDEMTWPFDKAQNIILNLAMGGGWGGIMGIDENISSQKMIIDYVRVYEKI